MNASTRIKSYSDAKTLVESLKKDDAERSSARAKVEGQLAGNVPYNPDQLRAKGQGYRSNVNFREMEGNVKTRVGSFVRLLFDSDALVNVEINDHEIPINYRYHYATIIREELHRMFRKIPSFYFSFSKAMRNMVVHGPGVLYWPTETEFIPKAGKPGKVFFSKNTSEDPDEYDVAVFVDELDWTKLFDLVSTPERMSAAKSRGWNLETVFTILSFLRTSSDDDSLGTPPQTPEEFQQLSSKRESFSTGDLPKTIDVAYIYSREESGHVTKSIVVMSEEISEKLGQNASYLYKKENEFSCFDEVLVVLLNELGNDGIHGTRGYGHRIYPHCVITNRMLNAGIDGAVISSTIVLQSSISGRKTLSDVLRLGPVTMLDESAKVVTGNFNANIQPIIQMRSVLQSNTANNFGSERPNQEGGIPGVSYKTARQTDYEMVKNNSLTNTEVLIFYIFADRVFSTIGKKLHGARLSEKNKKRVAEFKKRCEHRGVPAELLTETGFSIESSRSIGGGSAEMRLAMTKDVLGVSMYLQEEGQRNAIRDYLIPRVGSENADRYAPLYDTDKLVHFSHQLARFENNDMFLGVPSIVSADDDHAYHMSQHVSATMETIKAYTEGTLPLPAAQVVSFLALVISHMTSHMAFMQGGLNKQKLERIAGLVDQIKTFHKKMQNVARKEQAEAEAQQRQQQQILASAAEALKGTDLQLQLTRMQQEHEMRKITEENNNSIRQAKALHGMQLKEAETSAKIQSIVRLADAEVSSKGSK